jgi:hypothetical protein
MEILDSSKVQSFMDCPRGFFFRYVLGWTQEEDNLHLVFGSAWHDAMEHLYNKGLSAKSAAEAYSLFLDVYREAFPNEMTDDARRPKDPGTALAGLAAYVTKYAQEDSSIEVLFTEVAATVPIRSDRVIHAKCDAIIRKDGSIWSHEHKTSGRNSEPWRDQWHLKIQVGSYSHLLFSAFPSEHVEGVMINATVLTKSRGAEFLRIPVRKRPVDMQQYLWEVNHWVDQIEMNFKHLSACRDSDDVMTCFPKNSESCSKFGCRYPGLCTTWTNPLQNQHRIPPGLVVDFWDPRRTAEEAKNIATMEEGKLVIKPKEQKDQADHDKTQGKPKGSTDS